MDLTVRERVHVMPVGYERDRIVIPAESYRADRVILIGHKNDDSNGKKCWERVVDDLNEKGIDYEENRCDIFDLYSSLGTFAEEIANHEEDDVYVNVASGSKITAIAGMIASMVLDATAYYVKAKKYGSSSDFKDLPSPESVEQVSELPKYPINAPNTEEVVVLDFISRCSNVQGPPTKGEIIHFSEKVGLSYISRDVAEKGKYRVLDVRVIEPLKKRGYINETKQGRNKVIGLSRDGKAALEAFRWMVDNDIDWKEHIQRNQNGNDA